jgi:hypothetical protein
MEWKSSKGGVRCVRWSEVVLKGGILMNTWFSWNVFDGDISKLERIIQIAVEELEKQKDKNLKQLQRSVLSFPKRECL